MLFFVLLIFYVALPNIVNAENYAPTRRPFNYKAFEAKRHGYSVVNHRPIQRHIPFENICNAPIWPGYLRFPNVNTQLLTHTDAGVTWANWGFDNRSELVDPSVVTFGRSNVTVADISLISRLHGYSLKDFIANNKQDPLKYWIAKTSETLSSNDPELLEKLSTDSTLTATSASSALANDFKPYRRYNAYLASKPLDFKSQMIKPFTTITYQIGLFGGKVALGIELPVTYRVNKLEMIKKLTGEDNQVLSRDAGSISQGSNLQDYFFARYPLGYSDYYEDILSQKGLKSDKKATRFGIGDVCFFVNRKLDSDYFKLGVAGLGLVFPSATHPDRRDIWPAELGNGGFWEARVHGGFFWQSSEMINLSLAFQAKYRFSSSVERRVPRKISYDAVNTINNSIEAKTLPLGNNLKFADKSFTDELESKIPSFAYGPMQQVEYRKGTELTVRIGNVFDQAFFSKGYLDLGYEVFYKFSDSIAFRYDEGEYDTKTLMSNTDAWSQKATAGYCYRYSENLLLEAKTSYVLAGGNALREVSLSMSAQYSF